MFWQRLAVFLPNSPDGVLARRLDSKAFKSGRRVITIYCVSSVLDFEFNL